MRLAGLASLLVPEGSRHHQALSAAAAQLQEAWTAGSAAFSALANADPACLAQPPAIAELVQLWAAEVPEWPTAVVLDPAWQRVFWQFHRLRRLFPDSAALDGVVFGAGQVKVACLSILAAMQQLRNGAPADAGPAGALAEAVLVMLGADCAAPRTLACRVAAVGRDLGTLAPAGPLAELLAMLHAPGVDDAAALVVVRRQIASAGDKAYGWLLQAVAAVLQGRPAASGLDAL